MARVTSLTGHGGSESNDDRRWLVPATESAHDVNLRPARGEAMTKPTDTPYIIEDRRMIAETPDLRAQILTLAQGDEVPWHYHTAVADTFVSLEGPMAVETKSAAGTHELQAGDSCSVPPSTPHRVAGRDGGRCRFVLVQRIGSYDFIPVES